jgi:hypothetical protein
MCRAILICFIWGGGILSEETRSTTYAQPLSLWVKFHQLVHVVGLAYYQGKKDIVF